MTKSSAYKVSVPGGRVGEAFIEQFEITDEDAKIHNMRSIFSGYAGRPILPGIYTRLYVGSVLMMSDTPAEIRDIRSAVRNANGFCLITGLGLGVVLQSFLRKPEVKHVTVIEQSQDVIDLVAPHYVKIFGPDRFNVICADALVWKAKAGHWFDFVWHDIWPEICTDNAVSMGTLHRKYGGRCDKQDSWCRAEVKLEQRKERQSIYSRWY